MQGWCSRGTEVQILTEVCGLESTVYVGQHRGNGMDPHGKLGFRSNGELPTLPQG